MVPINQTLEKSVWFIGAILHCLLLGDITKPDKSISLIFYSSNL